MLTLIPIIGPSIILASGVALGALMMILPSTGHPLLLDLTGVPLLLLLAIAF